MKTIRILASILIICTLLTACTVNLERNKPVGYDAYEDKYDVIDKGPVKGGVVRLFTTPVDTLNPLITSNMYAQDFLGLVFEGLYELDSSQRPVPVLAKSSVLSPDGLTLTVYLRENIKWHDKMPFKAEDVVFTINTLLDTKNNSIYSADVKYIQSAAAAGNTVIIKLKQPYSFIKNGLTFPIIPVHHFVNEKLNDKSSKANLTPVGTGPYRFNSYSAKAEVKLQLNEDWWNSAAIKNKAESASGVSEADNSNRDEKKLNIRLPYLSTVEIKVFNNINSANAGFQARDIDVLPAGFNEYRKYIGRTDINLKRYPGKNYEFLTVNIKKGPLTDSRLRNALNFMIDKKKLIDTAAPGYALPGEIPVVPDSWVYKLIDFNVQDSVGKARELMTRGGYVQASGKYVNRTSRKALTLNLIVNQENLLRVNTAAAIASQLGRSGITVNVVKLPWEGYNNAIKSGSFDLALSGYRISSIPDLSFAYSTAEIQSGLNVAGYSNPAVDGYLQQLLVQNDAGAQKDTLLKLLGIVLEDRPYIGLYFINESMMYSKNIRGAVTPFVWNRYNDITRWYLP